MKNTIGSLAIGGAVFVLLCSGAVQAASMNQANVSRDWEDIVAPAQQQAYEAGVKSYNQCLGQHHFKYAIATVTHSTGNTYQYSYVIGPVTWADFDTARNEASACESVYNSDVNPHLQSEISVFETTAAGFSRLPKNMAPYALVDVLHFWLKPGQAADDAFTKAVKEIYAAENKTHWPVYSSMSTVVAGGPGMPDYELDIFNKDWADFGAPTNPTFEKMLVNAYGQKKADEILKSVDAVIAKEEQHVDRIDPALSFTPSGN